MGKGKLITLEGVEGCGKSTQMDLLAKALKEEGRAVLTTAEPGGSALGEELRRIVKGTGGMEISPTAELFLFLSDRAQHVDEVIRPALEKGMVVLCDRFVDSTLAYQGYGRGLDLGVLRELNRIATSDIEPDLTIVLDCEARLGFERHRKKDHVFEGCRFHLEDPEFHNRVREGYRTMARQEPNRFRLIDASGSVEEVQLSVRRVCREAGI